jgi:hypothetical protein
MIIAAEFRYEEQLSGRPAGRSHEKAGESGGSDAEFRRRLKNISEWRKKRLAQGV